MYIRVSMLIDDFPFRLPAPLVLSYTREYPLTVEIRRATTEERQGEPHLDAAMCHVTGEIEAPEDICSMFETLADHQLPNESRKRSEWAQFASDEEGINNIDATGYFREHYLVPLDFYPEKLERYATDMLNQLWGSGRRVAQVVRWRYGERGGFNDYESRGGTWSLDGEHWYPFPTTMSVTIQGMRGARIGDEDRTALGAMLAAGQTEPVAHELYREAWEQRGSNPRSALVIGITAAEVGIKHAIGILVPDAAWLAMNAPSPPMTNIMRRYLPTLPARNHIDNAVKIPRQTVFKLISDGVELRNAIVHTGADAPMVDTLQGILLAVRDLLYLLDYYCGASWALENLTVGAKNELGL